MTEPLVVVARLWARLREETMLDWRRVSEILVGDWLLEVSGGGIRARGLDCQIWMVAVLGWVSLSVFQDTSALEG